MTDYPQWVRERACELANAAGHGVVAYCHNMVGHPGYGALNALADLIIKYETAPVDPDEALVCEMLRREFPAYSIQTDARVKSLSPITFAFAMDVLKLARERNAL